MEEIKFKTKLAEEMRLKAEIIDREKDIKRIEKWKLDTAAKEALRIKKQKEEDEERLIVEKSWYPVDIKYCKIFKKLFDLQLKGQDCGENPFKFVTRTEYSKWVNKVLRVKKRLDDCDFKTYLTYEVVLLEAGVNLINNNWERYKIIGDDRDIKYDVLGPAIKFIHYHEFLRGELKEKV